MRNKKEYRKLKWLKLMQLFSNRFGLFTPLAMTNKSQGEGAKIEEEEEGKKPRNKKIIYIKRSDEILYFLYVITTYFLIF